MSGKAARRAVREQFELVRTLTENPPPHGISPSEEIAFAFWLLRRERDSGTGWIACALRAHDLHAAHDLEAIEHAREAAR